mmetsp:Transcript_3299/g.3262  ORF Transcript_3299/g.3262 Transcript_3299/m.3262 type:complete len:263 (+) Transcript_3299:68-856(+)
MTEEAITVGYWSIRGLGAPLRMMVMFSGVPLNNVMYDLIEKDGKYDGSCWFSVKPELKARNPFINLPYVIDGDNIITQTNACFAYLGRRLDLWGNTDKEVTEVEQILCEIMDIRNDMVKYAYSPNDTHQELLNQITGKNGSFQKLELWLENSVKQGHSGTFLVGNHATAPDFHLYEMIYQYTFLANCKGRSNILETFPRLSFFYESFAALPENQRYLQSNIGRVNPTLIPLNQKNASFGAQPSGDVWIPGMEYDFNTYTGLY